MIIFHEIGALQQYLSFQRKKGARIGFVPTMGALHKGHLSLVTQCKSEADLTVCSIFVNPTQFNDPKDFEKYPVTIEKDIHLLVNEGTDILFLPSHDEIYPEGTEAQHHYNLGYLETILEGAHRPGHFQGVCQVVHRLLDIVQPHTLILGQKDYQQCMVLKKLAGLLQIPVKIVIGKTLREDNGLAMSSRNLRLSEVQKEKATMIYRCLIDIRSAINDTTIGILQDDATTALLQNGFSKVDYVSIADAGTLQPLKENESWDGKTPLVALIAAFMGEVRLIDNMLLSSQQ
jgi:pantoate--beta-alanine ligase